MLIDRYMPRFDASATSHLVVEAGPEQAFAAARSLDLSRSSGIRVAEWIRLVPERLRRWTKRNEQSTAAGPLTIDELTKARGWVLLGEDPGSELALGLVGRFSAREIGVVRVEPAAFTGFDRPGHLKLIVDLSIRPYGHGRSLATCELRVASTDETARNRLGRYWPFTRPAAAVAGRRILALIRSAAEHPSAPQAVLGGTAS